MFGDEIAVPKELREFMIDGAEETFLGQKNGAKKQYRYGNLHIREYEDKFLVHTDKVDPRKDPLGHLLYDAPEILAGIVCAVYGGSKLKNLISNKNNSKKTNLTTNLSTSLIMGLIGYTVTKKIKNYLE